MQIEVERGTSSLASWSQGSGPALVALHAGVADSRVWRDCVPHWVETGWRVVTFDRRGFGSSTWEPETFSHVDDLLAVMDANDVASAVLVGNSQGGRLAVDTALDHPGRVDALVLVAPAISGRALEVHQLSEDEIALDTATDEAEERGDLDEVNRLEAAIWLDGPTRPVGTVNGPERDLFLDMNGLALRAPDVGEETWPEDSWERLDELDLPILVVAGAHDVMPTGTEELVLRLPGAELAWLEESAHLPMLDDLDTFLAAVDPFLAAHARDHVL